MIEYLTEDKVRDKACKILGFEHITDCICGVGQITTFNQLGFNSVCDKPDGWYLPKSIHQPAIILETKNSKEDVNSQKWIKELNKNIYIANKKYKNVIGILYNGYDVNVYKNDKKESVVSELQNLEYYLSLFTENKINKQEIYNLTKKINDSLHTEFGIKNLYHRMIFTACALVSERYEGKLTKVKDLGYSTFHNSILNTLSKSLTDAKKQNHKLDILIEVYSEIKMNSTEKQDAINNFIDNVVEISESINSDYWNGEDVMAIFFNEFNRYKKKSESGQVFTPDHITSLMYHLIDINKNDTILDGACGSGSFLVKAMCNMIKEAGGINTKKSKDIKEKQLFGIEFDREIYALACANMLIHKDGKTNLEQMDTRTQTACSWIETKPITKVLMNPPFEKKYGCMTIVSNVLNSVPHNSLCAFILPDKKLEKEPKKANNILKRHTLKKIIKLPEKTFSEGITTSIFIFETGIPQNNKEIFTCYITDDGLETVKNQGRHDIRNRWQKIETSWVDIIHKQSGDNTIKWIKPSECLSYQTPQKEFEIYEEDFAKTILNYIMFESSIDSKSFNEELLNNILYSSDIKKSKDSILIQINNENKNE